MSDGYGSRRSLTVDRSPALVGLSLVPVLAAAVALLVGGAAVFRRLPVESTVAGVPLDAVFGGLLLVSGTCVLALGIASYLGLGKTTPADSPGVAVAAGFGAVAVCAVGLVGSLTFGLEGLGWALPALVAGLVVGAATLTAREDLGVTVPAGALAVAIGAVFLSGVVTPASSWDPTGLDAAFRGTVFVPLLTIFSAVVAGWAGVQALRGFGATGRQTGAFFLIGLNAALMLAVLLLLVAFIFANGFGYVVRGIEIGPGLHFHWPFVMEGFDPIRDQKGIFPAIVGTIWLVVGAVVFAVPLGVGAAVFVTEYAEQGRFTTLIEVATNGLWSTPSVVFGLFGYAFLVPRLGNNVSLFAGMLVLGFMLLPLVLITSREAIKSVPDEYRDASAALGVSKWETIKDVTLPAATPGIVTGVVIGIGRIAGETAPILIVTADNPKRTNAPDVLGSFEFTSTAPFVTNEALLSGSSALPYQLYGSITTGVVGDDPAYGWATALVLLLVVLSFYAVGIAARIYFRRKLQA